MASALTLYLVDSAVPDGTGFGTLQIGGTAPSVSTMGTGWTFGTVHSSNEYAILSYGSVQPATAFGTGPLPSNAPPIGVGAAFRTPGTISGSFAPGNWTAALGVIMTTAGTSGNASIPVNVWLSPDPAGVIGQTILSGSKFSTFAIATTTQQNTTGSFTPTARNVAGEYLFVQLACEVASGAVSVTGSTVKLVQDGTNSTITTSVFTPATGRVGGRIPPVMPGQDFQPLIFGVPLPAIGLQRGFQSPSATLPPIWPTQDILISSPATTRFAQSPAFTMAPQPITASVAPTMGYASSQDWLDRRFAQANTRFDSASRAPAPERTSQLAAAVFSDRLERPSLPSALYPEVYFAPSPERALPLPAVTSPDKLDRASVLMAQQFFVSGLPPKPEEKTQIDWSPSFPERLLRAVLFSASHPFEAHAPAPERTSPLAQSNYPDRVERSQVHASAQSAVTGEPPVVEAIGPLDNQPIFPAWLARALMQAAQQPPTLGFYPLPLPSLAAPVEGYASFPDWLPRPALAPASQAFTTGMSPRPEGMLALDWQPSFPERAGRPFLRASDQMAFAVSMASERTSVLAVPVFQDRADRPSMLASEQPPSFAMAPSPERTRSIATVTFQDWVPKALEHASQQLAVTLETPAPEAPLPLDGQPTFPAWLARATEHASLQPPSLGFSPFPLPSLAPPTKGYDVHPDWLARAQFTAAEYAPFFALAPAPLSTPTQGLAVFPDWLPPWRVMAAPLQAYEVFYPLPLPSTAAPVEGYASFPDRAERPALHASQQIASTELPPRPERSSPAAFVVFPDRAERPSLAASSQLASLALGPRPERSSPLAITGFPERVERPALGTASHAFEALAPKPERKSVLAQPAFPDRLDRVSQHATQPFVTLETPRPERNAPLTPPVFPDRIPLPSRHPALAPFESLYPQPILFTVPTFASGFYPDWVLRSLVHPELHDVFAYYPKLVIVPVTGGPGFFYRPLVGTFREMILSGTSADDAVDSALGLTPTRITIVIRRWSGNVGRRPFTETFFRMQGADAVRGPQPRLKVEHVSAHFVRQSGGTYEMGDVRVYPIRPYFENRLTGLPGGYLRSEIDPAIHDDATEVVWRLAQVNQAGTGIAGDYTLVKLDQTDALFYSAVLRRRNRPADSTLEPGDPGFTPGTPPLP